MYGLESTDLVVKYYDESFGVTSDTEWEWYLEKVKAFGGPVLDLACGTGRLALQLARQGFFVVAIDQSEGMLNVFRSKVAKENSFIQQRIHIACQQMSSFHLDQKFMTILCCDAFFHNLSVEDEIACLDCVAQHLLPGGRFIFNLPNPTYEFILKSLASSGKEFEERGRYLLKDHSELAIWQAQEANPLDQTITTHFRFVRFDSSGKELETGESSWSTRYLFKYEAIHLLYRCGFDVDSLEGDYRHGPIKEGSQLIFQAHLPLPDR